MKLITVTTYNANGCATRTHMERLKALKLLEESYNAAEAIKNGNRAARVVYATKHYDSEGHLYGITIHGKPTVYTSRQFGKVYRQNILTAPLAPLCYV